MRLDVDALVEAALADASTVKPASQASASEFSKLAEELEVVSKAPVDSKDARAERARFHKLAMAVILSCTEDPKAKRGMEALSQDIIKAASGGGLLNDAPDPTPGDRPTVTIEKQQIAKGRTLFKKLQDGAPAAAAETNG